MKRLKYLITNLEPGYASLFIIHFYFPYGLASICCICCIKIAKMCI